MAILRPETGKSYTLSLKYKAPTARDGQFGKQFQYYFSNGDTAYLPPIAHAEIESLHLDIDQPFTLTKTQGKEGVRFAAELVAQPKPMRRATSVVRENRTTEIGAPSLTTPQSTHLFKQLVATIEAVKAAEQFAKQIDRPVTFTEADIRAMAISGFIDSSRRQVAA